MLCKVDSKGVDIVFRAYVKEEAFLLGKISPELFIKRPFRIVIERDKIGGCVVSDNLGVYGIGITRESAIRDYKNSLIEYYEIMEKESKDHEPTAMWFRQIQTYIVKFNALPGVDCHEAFI